MLCLTLFMSGSRKYELNYNDCLPESSIGLVLEEGEGLLGRTWTTFGVMEMLSCRHCFG